MSENRTREIVEAYYEAWKAEDRESLRSKLADDVSIVSAQGRFASADAFLDSSWEYAKTLADVELVREVYAADRAFVIARWKMADGSSFADAELIRIVDGKVSEILVVASDPELSKLLEEN